MATFILAVGFLYYMKELGTVNAQSQKVREKLVISLYVSAATKGLSQLTREDLLKATQWNFLP